MINQLSKFFPHLTDKTQSLLVLLSTKNHWVWREEQELALNKLKDLLTSSAMYDPNLDTAGPAEALKIRSGNYPVVKRMHVSIS